MSDYSRCPFEGEMYEARTVAEQLDVLEAIVEGPCLVACDRCDLAVPAGELVARPCGIGRPVCAECAEELQGDDGCDRCGGGGCRACLGVASYSGR